MGIVNALRFSDFDGAMISDEEFLVQDRRRTFFQNSIQDMLPSTKIKHGLELWYGGTGYPSFHFEVVEQGRRRLSSKLENNNWHKNSDSIVYKCSQEIMSCIHETTKNRLDQVLMMLFGFNSNDLHRGYFEKDDKRYNINQSIVKQKAMELINYHDKNSKLHQILKSRALLMGYDPEDGLQMFYANIENQVLSFNSGGYDTIGYGIYAAGQVFANYMRKKHLANRIKGYHRVEGVVTLIESALVAAQTYRGIGGYFHLLYIDGKASPKAKLIDVERVKLASEVVDAYKQGFINQNTCLELVDQAIFQQSSLDEMDNKLFSCAKNAHLLEMYLRGYRIDTVIPTKLSEAENLVSQECTEEEKQ